MPLWLAFACEELRLFSYVERLDEKIRSLPDDLPGLVEYALERVIRDSVIGGDLLQSAFSLISCSTLGLTRQELCELLAIEPTLPPNAELKCIKSIHAPLGEDAKQIPEKTVRLQERESRITIHAVYQHVLYSTVIISCADAGFSYSRITRAYTCLRNEVRI